MSDDPSPPAHRIWTDVGIPSERLSSVASDQAIPLSAEAIPLSREADLAGISVADEIALHDAALRQWMARRIMRVFVGTNIATLVAFACLVWLDHASGGGPAPGDRIITSQVFMTLLGATTVQVGAIAFTIAGYLFPRRIRQ